MGFKSPNAAQLPLRLRFDIDIATCIGEPAWPEATHAAVQAT